MQRALFYGALLTIFALAAAPATIETLDVMIISDKLNHLAAFVLLAVLCGAAYPNRSVRWQCSFLISYGMLIECVQLFLPYRKFSLLDIAADASGILVYVSFKRARRFNFLVNKK
ncbi:MAG: VanZ family protein [Nitrospirota bacterium]